jgi:hypothetical protein
VDDLVVVPVEWEEQGMKEEEGQEVEDIKKKL